MTPCEERGWKVGDRFRVTAAGHTVFEKGEIVALHNDNGSRAPYFMGVHPDDFSTIHIIHVEPAPNWTGPADGLPPVGVECEVDPLHQGEWYRVRVIAHDDGCAVYATSANYPMDCSYDSCATVERFRAIKSDRERAIDEMTWIAGRVHGPTARDVAEELYEQGYRKTVTLDLEGIK